MWWRGCSGVFVVMVDGIVVVMVGVVIMVQFNVVGNGSFSVVVVVVVVENCGAYRNSGAS